MPVWPQAAGFLRDVLASSGAAADAGALSPEQFSLKREAEARSRGAELITIDAAAEGEAAGAAYRPKVATWGVFPRPANISREFGGGRTIQPGQALEPEEVREARKARVAAAMAAYRKDQVRRRPGAGAGRLVACCWARTSAAAGQLTVLGVVPVVLMRAMRHACQAEAPAAAQGLSIDAAVAAEAEAAMAAGAEQMQGGCLSEALVLFCTAADAVPLRSRLGGEATLQRAICLDSMVGGGLGWSVA